jgi:uncharacterized protein
MSEEISGFSIPFRIDPASGRVAWASGMDKLKENITHILLTGLQERVMRRDYGGGLRQLVHDPNNEALRAVARHQIAKAIQRHEPRIQLNSLELQVDGACLYIDLRYTVRQTRQAQTLSVPIGLGGI